MDESCRDMIRHTPDAQGCNEDDADHLARRWQDAPRPLNWQPWRAVPQGEQARRRSLQMWTLQALDLHGEPDCTWRETHRELLELKACSGHATGTA